MMAPFLSTLGLSVMMITTTLFNAQSITNTQDRLDDAVKKSHRNLEQALKKEVPSVSVLLVTPKGEFFSSSAGKNGKAVTKDTWFRFASNTKNFTSTAILLMMQDGWLRIDDKIDALIPGTQIPYVSTDAEFKFPHREQITIKQLLQHNAGVYDLTNDDSKYNLNGETYADGLLLKEPLHQFGTEEYMRILTEKKLTYGPPNTVYHYSNTGYSILGSIIAKIYSLKSGAPKTYSDFIHDKISGATAKIPIPVHFVESAKERTLPTPNVSGMLFEKGKWKIQDSINLSANIAEGNGTGTMSGLAKYVRTLMKGQNVLTETSVNLMQTSVGQATTAENNHYALGCFYRPNLGYGHNGAIAGNLSLMLHDPVTDVTSIVLIPFWDLESKDTFMVCFKALESSAEEARKALGY